MERYCFFTLVAALAVPCVFAVVQIDYSPILLTGQQQAVENLIERVIGNASRLFNVSINENLSEGNKAAFKLTKETSSDQVFIEGSSSVAIAWGFHYYLKHFCDSHISWDYDEINLPQPLPDVNITVNANDIWRYYQNVCTWSYSYVWWDWGRWEREIDWMALNGINMALAFNGQEAVWNRVYKKFNMKEADIDKHFTGPAFLAWGRMGNMRGFGGPLNDNWHEKSLVLQHKILARMRLLGINPVLPAFSGQVPRSFKELFPGSTFTELPKWNNFADDYCCPLLLSPTDQQFEKIADSYMKEMLAEFGSDHVYACDTFNEMNPHSGDTHYLANMSRAIYRSMVQVDPKSIWLLQGWLFHNDPIFWTESRAKAFLTAVPAGSMIVLDLHAEQNPQYTRLSSFFGQPFIWCMLHNFGGTLGMHGSVESVNNNVFIARTAENSSMVGTGLTPEGINQNYVMYELMTEMGYRKEPVNLVEWFTNYARRRYGQENEEAASGWKYLLKSTYNYTQEKSLHGKYTICRRPGFNIRPQIWYDPSDVLAAWSHLISASNKLAESKNYAHDVVDITRQAMQILFEEAYARLIKSYDAKKQDQFQTEAENIVKILADLEKILATNEKFLLGVWIKAARDMGYTPLDANLYEYNARNQITLWGPNGEILDYATKQWSGIVSHYYAPRWKYFITTLNTSLTEGIPFNHSQFSQDIFKHVEQPFTLDLTMFPTKPDGDTVETATDLYNGWHNFFLTMNAMQSMDDFKEVILV
ncbi:alpha-N-acetylglucosaminidase isoform X1 [Bemisia tabaci]|uniref:alpha-N-acetylglucosaminidase isoform X1 n=2 Tax=Bemisia tabaci TaxID=7038 RepID=UPI003B283A80